MIHNLKIYPRFYQDINSGKKTFEVRKKDRNYKVGDFLELNEFDLTTQKYTGSTRIVRITYLLDDERFCKSGYIVLGISLRIVEKIKLKCF